MTLLRLGPDALRASRFALSPLAETLGRLIALRRDLDIDRDHSDGHSHGHSHSDRWQPNADATALRSWLCDDPFAAGILRLVSATKYLPDFVVLPPTSMTTRIEDELARMRAVSDTDARATIVRSRQFAWVAGRTGWTEVDDIAGRAAEVFARGWKQFVEPDWPRRRAIMERDIRHRAGVLAVSGWRHALDDMASGVRWVGPDAIQFSTQTHADRVVGDEGLVFVPHTGTTGKWTCETPTRLALVYPARGALAPTTVEHDGIARLIGAGRARILHELQSPATPSQLAVLLGLSLGTVSGHLAALRNAGVVVGRRTGRAVYYERTARRESLAHTLTGPADHTR